MPTPEEYAAAETILHQFGYRLAEEVSSGRLYKKRGCRPCWVNDASVQLIIDHKVNHDGLHLGVPTEPQKKKRH